MTIDAYPLHWPDGWKRTPNYSRDHSKFKSTFAVARDELMTEINRLQGGRWYRGADPVLSTNVELRQDGLPYAGRKAPEDTGVAVYFEYKKKPMVFACDKYVYVWENMVAIRKTIEAIRGMERWGASDMMERAFQGFAALPDQSRGNWHHVLNVFLGATREEVESAYRRLRSQYHPDRAGGDAVQFDRVQKAWEQYQAERG